MTVKVEGKKKQSGKKNPVNSRAKGARGEREFSKFCKEFGYDVHRTAQHCGKTGEAADCIGLPGIHIEVKRVESLRMDDALDQAIRDAAKQGNIPIVAHRRNDRPWVIIMLGSDWFELYRAFELAMEEGIAKMQNPRKINLCGRCADILRDRYILKVEERQCNKDVKCELCKKVRFGGTYTMMVRRTQ